MKLNHNNAKQKNKLYEKLRYALQDNPMAFVEYKLYSCKDCSGTGLKGVKRMNDETGFSWSGEYCDACKGIGVVPEKNLEKHMYEILESFYCGRCNGKGCPTCKNTGFVDWITHARGC